MSCITTFNGVLSSKLFDEIDKKAEIVLICHYFIGKGGNRALETLKVVHKLFFEGSLGYDARISRMPSS